MQTSPWCSRGARPRRRVGRVVRSATPAARRVRGINRPPRSRRSARALTIILRIFFVLTTVYVRVVKTRCRAVSRRESESERDGRRETPKPPSPALLLQRFLRNHLNSFKFRTRCSLPSSRELVRYPWSTKSSLALPCRRRTRRANPRLTYPTQRVPPEASSLHACLPFHP